MRDAMPLTDRQIERYSRQIIVPGIGGLAQERLLAARVTLCGDARDIEASLAYLAGAGIGEITLASSDNAEINPLLSKTRKLNPDVVLLENHLSETLSLTRERSAHAKRAPGEGRPEFVAAQTVEEEGEYPHPGQGGGTTQNRKEETKEPQIEGTERVVGENAPLLFLIIGSPDALALARSIPDVNCPAIVARLDDPVRIAILPSPPPCSRCAGNLLSAPFRSRSETAGFAAMIATSEVLKLLAGYGNDWSVSMIEFSGFAANSRAVATASQCECSRRARDQGDAR